MTLIAKIIEALKTNDGLSDKQLSYVLDIPRSQPVNNMMRKLVKRGVVRRIKGSSKVILNYLEESSQTIDKGQSSTLSKPFGRGTLNTMRMRLKRESPEGQLFKQQIIKLLQDADDDIAFALKRDLSRIISHPFYGEKLSEVDCREDSEILLGYAELLAKTNDTQFRKKLIRAISAQQECLLKKYARIIGPDPIGNQIREHLIPTKFVADQMLILIEQNKLNELPRLLDLYRKAGQRALSLQHDKILNQKGLKDCMPQDWDWRKENVDYLARYRMADILHHVFLHEHEL